MIAAIVCLVTVGCKQYKIRLSHAKAQNEQLELEVINMESQVTMMHGQMRGIHVHTPHMHGCSCKRTHVYTHIMSNWSAAHFDYYVYIYT